ncbi:hypothetical protein RRG08_037604 [Elysia crispata]|uniref:Uncharacterized protein n=1 Tax=Elysia crispata TaxID=231223 RepID=A0AAE0YH05_9GAST|nr:hypothetical protein RRG08_037604 [Elysia crispata]
MKEELIKEANRRLPLVEAMKKWVVVRDSSGHNRLRLAAEAVARSRGAVRFYSRVMVPRDYRSPLKSLVRVTAPYKQS